ncbi:MAG: serine/threonine-protein kinase [Enhygromyxa sp.]
MTEPHDRTTLDSPAELLPALAVDELARSLARNNIHARLFGGAEPPLVADRFEIEGKLGSGGMSTVFRAHDRQLGRAVALKFMRPLSAGASGQGERRLLREARALARIAHPNVISVYDFGVHEDRVWVAMEHVLGRTLRELSGREQGLRARLDTWIALGRGLAAVHAVELVHRDVKPDNALLGDDGRVRLIDLGLVRFADDPCVPEPTLGASDHDTLESGSSRERSSPAIEATLTVRGAALGTPAYMAPEQLRGEPATRRSDQFALCLCMVEAITGERPFAAASVVERLESMARGAIGRLPASLPRRARAALRRGLAFEPAQRWATVDELLDELERAFERRRRGWVLAGTGSLCAAVIALELGRAPAGAPDLRCEIDPEALTGSFDEDRIAALHAAFANTKLPFAERSAALVEHELRGWAQRWHEGRRAACRATRVLGLQSEALLDRQIACFDRARAEFGELTRLFAEADARVVTHAPELLAELPSLSSCGRLDASAEPSLSANEVDALAELARGRALLIAGDPAGVLASVAKVEQALAAVDESSPARLRARALEAELDVQAERFDAGFRALREVADAAARAKLADDEASLRVGLALHVVGSWSRPDLERWWLADAELALARVAAPDDPRWIELMRAQGLLAQARGDYPESERLFADALAAAEARELWLLADDLRMDLANSLRKREAFADARAHYNRVIADNARRWGPEHPHIAHAEHNLGILEVDAGRFEQARIHLQRAIALYELAWGPDALGALRSRLTLVHVATSTGQLDQAAAALELLLPRLEAALGPEHRETAHAYNTRGALHFYAGDYEASIAAYERALAGFVAANGEDHDEVGLVLGNLGESFAALGQREDALESFERGLAILERRLGPEHADLGPALKGRGLLRLDSGLWRLAIADLERALALLEHSGDEPLELAEARVALARALREGEEHERAEALARQALADFEQLGLEARARALRRELGLR